MHISICDDDPAAQSELKNLVESFLRDKEEPSIIHCHADPIRFLEAAKADVPDVAFLDLVLGEMSGFDAAKELRKISRDTEIVFVTSYAYHMSSAFEYKPVAFLAKPISRESVDAALETIMRYRWQSDLAYTVRGKAECRRIPHKDIEYIESSQHRIMIHLADEKTPIFFPGKLDEVEIELRGLPYIRCHKSYIVQAYAIRTLEKGAPSFSMKSGRRVPISRRFYKQAVCAFLQYKI